MKSLQKFSKGHNSANIWWTVTLKQRRIKLQDLQLNEIPQYLVCPCVKSPTVARATRDFRYQDNTGTLSPVSGE